MNDNHDSELQFLCPITAYPCEGDLSHLCEEYGCARKGGLSPHSEENLSVGPVAGLVGIEGGVVSGVFNLESPGVRAPGRRPRHDQRYHEA